MNKMQMFNHHAFGELPVLVVDNVEWFGATEAAKSLSFADPYKAITNHVEVEDSTVHPVLTDGGQQNKKFINESGLYSLIFGAAKQGNNQDIKEKAKIFKRWVTNEVLPTIRKTGAYMTPQTLMEALASPDGMIQVLTRLKDEQNARAAAEAKILADRPKVLYAESMEISRDSILVGEMAKLLRQNGVDIGERRLFEWLRNNGYLIKSGSEYNSPTQRSMDLGIMEIKMGYRSGSDGIPKITKTPKITGKGQIYLMNKFKAQAV